MLLTLIDKLVITGLYSGRIPISPGTCGSLAALIVWLLLVQLGLLPSLLHGIVLVVVTIIVGTYCIARFLRSRSCTECAKDPQFIVIDEWAGLFISLLPITQISFLQLALGFVLFRLFDILKPGPVRAAEKLPGAWGIMADDLLAGIFAALCLAFIVRFV